jgi:hypothetical protein
MPKSKPSMKNVLNKYVDEFGENIFSSDDSVLFCKLCETRVSAERRYIVTQHLKTDKHTRSVNRHKNATTSKIQQQVTLYSKKCTFSKDLCKALLSANIPLNKVNNKDFRLFMEKYTNKEIPDESTLRKNYVNDIYVEIMNKIRSNIIGHKIWVSVDETTDVQGRYIANVIIGTLEVNKPGQVYLLNSEMLEKTNYSTITKVFDQSMFLLWPDGIRHDDVLLFLSDAAPYMVKAGKTIGALYSKMVHVTCLAHGIHRVAEEIRGRFTKVDKLISKVKQIFLKCPARVFFFKNRAPNVPLPPEPIITRWGTWLRAASYYCTYFQEIKNIVLELNQNDAISIKEVQKILNNPSLETDLVYIHTNFGYLPDTIEKLENQGLPLATSIEIVRNISEKLNSVSGNTGMLINEKFKNVLAKNKGFEFIQQISNILIDEKTVIEGLPEELSIQDFIYFKYAPITSVDVERSFSIYKNLLSSNRRSFEFENLKKSFIVQCNNF